MFEGVYTALATPFLNNRVDRDAFRKLIDFQAENGVHGIVVCGTSGESATLSMQEHHELIQLAVQYANKRIKVIAGTGSNNTAEAVELSVSAEKSGADGLLIITPYYNKPTQRGLYEHFRIIGEAVSIPIILYDAPGRTSVTIKPETVARLYADVKTIIGLKEATGSIGNAIDILELVDEDFLLLSGDDFILVPTMGIGGKGVISVSSNVIPARIVELYNLYKSGRTREAAKLQIALNRFNKAMFWETNPIPVKYALYLTGFISDEIRPPLTVLDEPLRDKMRDLLKQYNVEVTVQ